MVKKRTFLSKGQRDHLISYMKSHPELARGTFSPEFTRSEATKLWEDVAKQLNSIAGANRIPAHWRNTWKDMKKNAKNKSAALKRHREASSYGSTSDIKIEINDGVLDFLNPNTNEEFPFNKIEVEENDVVVEEIVIDNDDNDLDCLKQYTASSFTSAEAANIRTKPNESSRLEESDTTSKTDNETFQYQKYIEMASKRDKRLEFYQQEKLRLLNENNERRKLYEMKKVNILSQALHELKDIKKYLCDLSLRKIF